MYIKSCKSEIANASQTTIVYPLAVVDNEIRLGDEVLYRFIPVDGGPMNFTYKYPRIQSDQSHSWEDTVNIYSSKRLYIPSMLIGETPVTMKLWEYVMNGRTHIEGDINSSVIIYVTRKTQDEWLDFIDKLSEKTGCKFRLPSSFQWEYAARGGQKSQNYIYAGSNDIKEVAKYSGNSRGENILLGKEKAANELGLYDMSGGVLELTSSTLGDIFPFVNSQKDFKENYISRGGDYLSPPEECETRYMKMGYITATGARLILEY